MGGDSTQRQEDSALSDAASALCAHVHVHVPGGCGPFPPLRIDRVTSIGRRVDTAGADLALPDDRMSRLHATLEPGRLAWRLVDQGSTNRGFVDGVPFAPRASVPVRDGSVIRLGDSLLVFRTGEPVDAIASDAFPGRSREAAATRRAIQRLATTAGHVLVLGETGTGKERVARAIGDARPPFVPQNCAELTRELARSELFGHARGAFSGAFAAKPGLVEVADSGVLFLDEIGELSFDLQADLLRFLEDGTYRRVGATELQRSNARVVAATNVDLDEAVRTGRFRRDLLARLRASNPSLVLAPLRERREDIALWARIFLGELGSGQEFAWSAGFAECLLLYPWPDNLRELRGVIRGCVAAERGGALGSDDLPPQVRAHRSDLRRSTDAAPETVVNETDPTREQIIAALEETRGRMLTASQRLHIDRRKLYRLCETLGVDFTAYRASGSTDED